MLDNCVIGSRSRIVRLGDLVCRVLIHAAKVGDSPNGVNYLPMQVSPNNGNPS